MNPTETTDTALQALLESLIDYAGLFPPAGLDMATAVANYAGYKDGPLRLDAGPLRGSCCAPRGVRSVPGSRQVLPRVGN